MDIQHSGAHASMAIKTVNSVDFTGYKWLKINGLKSGGSTLSLQLDISTVQGSIPIFYVCRYYDGGGSRYLALATNSSTNPIKYVDESAGTSYIRDIVFQIWLEKE